jgi:hypothetical protein
MKRRTGIAQHASRKQRTIQPTSRIRGFQESQNGMFSPVRRLHAERKQDAGTPLGQFVRIVLLDLLDNHTGENVPHPDTDSICCVQRQIIGKHSAGAVCAYAHHAVVPRRFLDYLGNHFCTSTSERKPGDEGKLVAGQNRWSQEEGPFLFTPAIYGSEFDTKSVSFNRGTDYLGPGNRTADTAGGWFKKQKTRQQRARPSPGVLLATQNVPNRIDSHTGASLRQTTAVHHQGVHYPNG